MWKKLHNVQNKCIQKLTSEWSTIVLACVLWSIGAVPGDVQVDEAAAAEHRSSCVSLGSGSNCANVQYPPFTRYPARLLSTHPSEDPLAALAHSRTTHICARAAQWTPIIVTVLTTILAYWLLTVLYCTLDICSAAHCNTVLYRLRIRYK